MKGVVEFAGFGRDDDGGAENALQVPPLPVSQADLDRSAIAAAVDLELLVQHTPARRELKTVLAGELEGRGQRDCQPRLNRLAAGEALFISRQQGKALHGLAIGLTFAQDANREGDDWRSSGCLENERGFIGIRCDLNVIAGDSGWQSIDVQG